MKKGLSGIQILRIVLPSFVTIVLYVISLFFVGLPSFEDALLDVKREMIRELTRSSISRLDELNEKVFDGDLTVNEAQELGKEEIRNLRYGSEYKDYFWINDKKPVLIMHPYLPQLEGGALSNFVDTNGTPLLEAFLNAVDENDGSGYVVYYWQWKDDSNTIVPKLSYVEEFEPWGWIVGTGIYIEDVRKEIKSITRKITWIFLIVLLFVSLISLYVIAQWGREEFLHFQSVQRLQEKEQWLDLSLSAAEGFLFDADIVGQEVLFDTRYFKFLDMTKENLPSNFQELKALIHPEDGEEFLFLLNAYLKNQTPRFHSVFRLKVSEPVQWLWLDAKGKIAEYDSEGHPVRMVGVCMSVQEQKEYEEALKVSEEKFRGVFNQTFQFIAILDLEGKVVRINDTALNFLGNSQNDVFGEYFWDTAFWNYSMATQQKIKDSVESAKEGKVVRFETVHFGVGTRKVSMDVVVKPVRKADGEIYMILVEGRDIGILKKAEQELSSAQEKMRKIIDTLPFLTVAADFQMRVFHWNQMATQFIGYSFENALGRNLFELLSDFDLDEEKIRNAIEKKQRLSLQGVEAKLKARVQRFTVHILPLQEIRSGGVVILMELEEET